MECEKNTKVGERPRRAKGDILLRVLERVAEGAGDAAAMFGAFLSAGYGASYGKLERELAREHAGREAAAQAVRLEREARRKYRKLFYLLKKDGLVEEKKKAHNNIFLLTRRGVAKLAELRKRKLQLLPRRVYEPERADVFTIVTFDVPERDRKKREWLRETLRSLGFDFVQRSVWIGKVKLPKEFLEDIQHLNLIDSVEIFQITKTGSLKHLM
ncbi:MAG: CRISPR-associated endonuclease Cas2 [Candidatus Jorgensenbacteria bacterium]